MGMSYRRAWLLVKSMNECFRARLVDASKGGASGGGAELTATGREVLHRYRAMEARATQAVAEEMAAFRNLLVERAPEGERD
jgi:molybdate transport system regulatory protein